MGGSDAGQTPSVLFSAVAGLNGFPFVCSGSKGPRHLGATGLGERVGRDCCRLPLQAVLWFDDCLYSQHGAINAVAVNASSQLPFSCVGVEGSTPRARARHPRSPGTQPWLQHGGAHASSHLCAYPGTAAGAQPDSRRGSPAGSGLGSALTGTGRRGGGSQGVADNWFATHTVLSG